MIQLMSRWGEALDKEKVWQEYPRPGLVRDSYLNLNGQWDYCINQSEYTDTYDGKILVPFSPESVLSGVERQVGPEQFLHYKKCFRLPEGFLRDRVILHFGAVDQECEVYLNGVWIGGHKGGYLPFHFDVTDALKEENVLTLRVTDQTELQPHARGKQKLVKKGRFGSLFYTPQSGIWQTVWLESVPADYIEWVKITPLYDESAVRIRLKAVHAKASAGMAGCAGECAGGTAGVRTEECAGSTAGTAGVRTEECAGSIRTVSTEGTVRTDCAENEQHMNVERCTGQKAQVVIFDGGQAVAKAQLAPGRDAVIQLEGFRSWSPEDPHLYDVKITMGQDEVFSYFGMRKVSVGRDKSGILRFFLNNQPYFFNGLLDQGYWPESLMTPPSDEALVYDIKKLKEMGYNTIRKHVKIELERFYYHCDRLGMIVWQDMPNGGGEYNMVFVTYLPNLSDRFARGTKDNHYEMFKRADTEGRRQYYRDLAGMVKHLYNYPCIVTWVPFNEGWGQFDAKKATEKLRRMDRSRLINEACGWFDQKGGDMHSIHNYNHRLVTKPKDDRVVALTEYGGYAYPVKGHIACEKEFGYRHYSSSEELTANYRRLWEEEIFPNVERGLSAAIYTQVSDIEEEINGVMTYDREIVKLNPETVSGLNQRLYEDFRCAAGVR